MISNDGFGSNRTITIRDCLVVGIFFNLLQLLLSLHFVKGAWPGASIAIYNYSICSYAIGTLSVLALVSLLVLIKRKATISLISLDSIFLVLLYLLPIVHGAFVRLLLKTTFGVISHG